MESVKLSWTDSSQPHLKAFVIKLFILLPLVSIVVTERMKPDGNEFCQSRTEGNAAT